MFKLSTKILERTRRLFDVRLQMFVFYPKTLISSRDMASAGFYYASEDRVLKCSGCKSTVTRFSEGDDPFVTGHRFRCPFVRMTKKTEKPVAAAAAAAVEHSLSPLGESYYVNLAHSANLPTGLCILLALISSFYFFLFFFYYVQSYLSIYWTDFHDLFTNWKVFA